MAGLMRSIVSPSAISPAEATRDVGGWIDEGMSVGRDSAAGVNVSEHNMVSLSAVFAAIRAISEDTSKLPLKLYERGDMRGAGLPRGKLEARDHEVWSLVTRRPNPAMTPFDFRQAVIASAMMWHGGFAEILRNGGGRPRELWPVHPSLVTVQMDDDGVVFYRIHRNSSLRPEGSRDVDREDMLHLKGFGDNGLVGWMIARVARDSIGVYKAAETFTAKFFANGAAPGGVVSFEGNVKQDTLDDYQKRLQQKQGGVMNAFKIMMFGGGAKFTPTTVDAEKAQLTETLQFRVEDIARWFRIPPHKIQHLLRSTFSNIESQSLEYVVDTLMPWLVRFEQELSAKLLMEDEQDLFFEHSINGLLRGDMASRSQFYNNGIQGGWLTRNEVRDMENRNPYEGGDQFLVQQNVAIVNEDGEPEPANESPGEGSEEAPGGATDDGEQTSEQPNTAAWMPVFVDACERMIGREVKAVNGKGEKSTQEWLDSFYTKHEQAVAAALEPPIRSMCMAMGWDEPKHLAERHAAMHVAESKRMLSVAEDREAELRRWQDERPGRMACNLIDEVCDARS